MKILPYVSLRKEQVTFFDGLPIKRDTSFPSEITFEEMERMFYAAYLPSHDVEEINPHGNGIFQWRVRVWEPLCKGTSYHEILLSIVNDPEMNMISQKWCVGILAWIGRNFRLEP